MEVVLSVLGVLYVFRYFLNLCILHVDETKGSIESGYKGARVRIGRGVGGG